MAGSAAATEELFCDDFVLSWEVLVVDAEEFVEVRFWVWAVEFERGRVAFVKMVLLVVGRVWLV